MKYFLKTYFSLRIYLSDFQFEFCLLSSVNDFLSIKAPPVIKIEKSWTLFEFNQIWKFKKINQNNWKWIWKLKKSFE